MEGLVQTETEDAFRYRQRAAEVRAIAWELKNRDMQNILFGVAADYDKMADSMERIAKIDLTRDPPPSH